MRMMFTTGALIHLVFVIINSVILADGYQQKASTILQRSNDLPRNGRGINFNTSSHQNQHHVSETILSASSSSSSENVINDVHTNKKLKFKKSLLTACMSITYASIIVDVMTFPPCISLLKDQFPAKSQFYNYKTLLAVGTMVTMVGKFVLGPPTDEYGGELTMKASMFLIAMTLFLFSISQSFVQIAPLWILISFIYATAWGAVGKVIRENFASNEWGSQLGFVAGTSRLGSALSALLFSRILKSKVSSVGSSVSSTGGGIIGGSVGINGFNQQWRNVFRVGALFQTVVLLAYVLIDKFILSVDKESNKQQQQKTVIDDVITSNNNNNNNNNKQNNILNPDQENVSQVLKRVSSYPSFWLMLIAKMNLLMVGQFISFIPVYLTTSPSLRLPADIAVKASSNFAFGSLLSCVLGFKYYDKLSTQFKMGIVTVLNTIAAFIPLALCLLPTTIVRPDTISPILGLWGLCWAFPLYIPPGVYVLSLSRPHAALLTNIYDAAGFTLAGIFSYYAMKSGETGLWKGTLMSLGIGTALASICMYFALLFSSDNSNTYNKTDKKQQ